MGETTAPEGPCARCDAPAVYWNLLAHQGFCRAHVAWCPLAHQGARWAGFDGLPGVDAPPPEPAA